MCRPVVDFAKCRIGPENAPCHILNNDAIGGVLARQSEKFGLSERFRQGLFGRLSGDPQGVYDYRATPYYRVLNDGFRAK